MARCASAASWKKSGQVSAGGSGIVVSTTCCAELLEALDVRLARTVLGLRGTAHRRRPRQEPDRQPLEPRRRERRRREHRPHRRHLRDAGRHRPDGVEAAAERIHAVHRHPPPARLEADDAAARCGQADRAARVGADADVAEARRERSRVPARRAAGRAPREPRVLDGAVPVVLARHAPGELVQVRLADDDGTGGNEPLDRGRGARRDVVGVDARAVGRANARGVDQVLDEESAPVQRPRQRSGRLDGRDDRVVRVAHGT